MSLELVSVDFRDAFHMCPLKHDERQFVVAKDSYGWYHVSKVVQFGLSPGPLLWARLASAAMRFGQAIVNCCFNIPRRSPPDSHGRICTGSYNHGFAVCWTVVGVRVAYLSG
jgi:hypothetical protein